MLFYSKVCTSRGCILCNEYYNVSTSNILRASIVIKNTVYCSYKTDIKVGGKLLT